MMAQEVPESQPGRRAGPALFANQHQAAMVDYFPNDPKRWHKSDTPVDWPLYVQSNQGLLSRHE